MVDQTVILFWDSWYVTISAGRTRHVVQYSVEYSLFVSLTQWRVRK